MNSKQRRAIAISGIVQGVGFRPFVYSLASQLNLKGFIRNRSGGVLIEVEGSESVLNQFTDRLKSQPPPLSRIDGLSWHQIPAIDDGPFWIAESDASALTQTFVSPDVATCAECRDELFDRSDRRYRYPFLNCTHCGPRLTIICRSPYDRVNTTMAPFPMCDRCRTEYEDPSNRRFHAQPIACGQCGPRLQLLDAAGQPIDTADPLGDFCAAIGGDRIAAIKGIGGFHLVCSAASDKVVRTLRKRKHRDEKPFAVMVRDASVAAKWCEIDSMERELLVSAQRPIVLLRKRTDAAQISHEVAPDHSSFGVMLPSSPLHELLLDAWGDQPLVMTSGNRSDEPIAYEDSDASKRLRGIADLFLLHNRQIHVRCDDSVTRVIAGRESPIRRSRGYAPMPIKLPFGCPQPTLALGGQLKNVFALASGRDAFLSHHIGDLDHLAALDALKRDIELYEQLFGIKPRCVVHDKHPDYASTRYAVERADGDSIPALTVQHHHAHLASCMAEHQLDGEVIGVIFDGSGYSPDGTIWGGEFLVGGYDSFVRAGRLRQVRLPGGDKATKEPWRMALSYLADAECDADQWFAEVAASSSIIEPDAVRVVRQMIDRGFNSPWSSSAGRLFDAVAALAGVRLAVSFEGQAAMQLEALATDVTSSEVYPHVVNLQDEMTLDTRPLIRGVVDDRRCNVDAAIIARRFHNTLSAMIVQACSSIADSRGLDRVVLSGGVFTNALLSAQVAQQLTTTGIRVFQHHVVPANDGGLCLGQLAIAARQMQ